MPAMDTSHAHTHIVCGRFAPTPSGRMHLGNAFAALMAWLAVRSEGGRLVLRIEDLDPRAQVPERATAVMDDLRWLGLDWDEGPLWQSTRMNVYEEALCTLNRAKLTYPCFAHAPNYMQHMRRTPPMGALSIRADVVISRPKRSYVFPPTTHLPYVYGFLLKTIP